MSDRDDDDVPSAEELAEAAKLRDGLDRDPLVGALRAAWGPSALSEAEHRALVERAIARPAAVTGTAPVAELRPRRARIVATASVIVALAASIVLWLRRPNESALAQARSTQPLFTEPFKTGESSARIDRIALARASDYRDNRFAHWGVR